MACVAENKRENKQSNKNERGKQNEKQEKKPKKQNPRSYNAVNADCLYGRNGWLLVGFCILRKSEHYENTYGIPRIVYF